MPEPRGCAEEHFEQIAHLSPLDEGMAQGKLRNYLVTISSAPSLAQYVALLDELGQDLVGCALGDANCSGDVAQADAGVINAACLPAGGRKVAGSNPVAPTRE